VGRKRAQEIERQKVEVAIEKRCSLTRVQAYAPEGKIDQRGDKPGKSAGDPTIRINFDMARPVGVF